MRTRMSSITIYDPTKADAASAVRGVGRYLELLRQAFPDATYTAEAKQTDKNPFIHPFFSPLGQADLCYLYTDLTHSVAVIHDLIPLKYPSHFPIGLKAKINISLNRHIAKRFGAIVTDSEVSKTDIVNLIGVDASRVHVIYPYLSQTLQTDAQKTHSPLGKPYFLYVGDATWNKNLVNIAHAIMKTKYPLVCIGKVFKTENIDELTHPWQEELWSFLKVTRDNPQFILPGFVDNTTLAQYYSHAVANVLISHDEGFGFSYVEAGAHHTPSVLADRPIFHEISGDQGALFAHPDNPELISEALEQLTANQSLRQKLGAQAKSRSLTFTAARFRSQWLDVIASLSRS